MMKYLNRLPKSKLGFYLAALITVALCLIWLFIAASSVTVTDARVAADVITVRSQVDGTIARVYVTDGQLRSKDDLLIEIDDRIAKNVVEEQRAELERLSSIWEQLKLVSRRTTQSSRLTAADAALELKAAGLSVQAAEVMAAQSRVALDRSSRLAAQGLVAKASADQDKDAFDLARLNAALAATARIQKINDLNTTRLREDDALAAVFAADAAQHETAEAAAALEIAKLVHERHELRANGPGIIGKVLVRDGDSVIEGQRLLLKYDPRTVRIEARVSERDLRHFKIGKKVTISLDASDGKKIQGTITTVGALTQTATSDWPQQPEQGNFIRVSQKVPVQISIERNGAVLIPGTLAKVTSVRE